MRLTPYVYSVGRNQTSRAARARGLNTTVPGKKKKKKKTTTTTNHTDPDHPLLRCTTLTHSALGCQHNTATERISLCSTHQNKVHCRNQLYIPKFPLWSENKGTTHLGIRVNFKRWSGNTMQPYWLCVVQRQRPFCPPEHGDARHIFYQMVCVIRRAHLSDLLKTDQTSWLTRSCSG